MSSNQDVPLKTTPLFPAYSSHTNDYVEQRNEAYEEWLHNSSFIPTNYQEAPLQHVSQDSKSEFETFKKIKEETELFIQPKKRKKVKSKDIKISIHENFNLPAESTSLRSQLKKITFIEETGLSLERAYHLDVKCDLENRQFDCFERKHIAKYRLKLQIPFGLSKLEQLSWPLQLEAKIKKTPFRYFGKKALKILKQVEVHEEIYVENKLLPNPISDFIPISASKSTLKDDHTLKDFYGVSVNWKSNVHEKSPIAVKTSKNDDCALLDIALDNEIRTKTISFNKKLSESPHNIQLWLDFVEFQNELLKSQSGTSSSKLSESSIIDKKVAILDKAINHNPRSVELILAKLNLCKDLWKVEELISSWENLVFLNPHNPKVWRQYLLFILTNLNHFSTQRVLKLYSKCIRTFSNLNEGIIQSHEPPPDITYVMIEIFSQFCCVLQSCGYTERAIASFQALIEFNLFAPTSVHALSVSDCITCFEPFWDSGALRIGEYNAIGWAATIAEKKISSNQIVSESDSNILEDEILCRKLPLWKTWLEFENLREIHHWLPWRPNPEYGQTNDDIDDTDRTISYDDLSVILFKVSGKKELFYLIHQFFYFLGVNGHLFGCSYIADKKLQINLENDFNFTKFDEILTEKNMSSPFNLKIFPWNERKIDFVNNIFSQVMETFSLEHRIALSLLWLRFRKHHTLLSKNQSCFMQNINDLKKFAKSMLKKNENRNCLLLWLEYIEIECMSGTKLQAKKTFETLLASSSIAFSNGTMEHEEIWFFVRSYVEFCIGLRQECDFSSFNNSREKAICLLSKIGNKENFDPFSDPDNKPTFILKAVSGFKHLLDKSLSNFVESDPTFCACLGPYEYSALDCLLCFAYFQYLTLSLDAALMVLNNTSELLETKLNGSMKSYILEHLCVLQANLVNFHTWNSSASIKPLQCCLFKAVEKYPSNSQLLYHLVKVRHASSVVGPTRRFFYKLLKNQDKLSPITWIFAIVSELGISYSLQPLCKEDDLTLDHTGPSLGINWKIRALYERALQSTLCSYTPILWRSYIKFEIQCGDSFKAKRLFHTALQNCVWSKELHMDAVEYFPEDLKQILDLMLEKHLRIRTPLEEVALLMEHAIQDSE